MDIRALATELEDFERRKDCAGSRGEHVVEMAVVVQFLLFLGELTSGEPVPRGPYSMPVPIALRHLDHLQMSESVFAPPRDQSWADCYPFQGVRDCIAGLHPFCRSIATMRKLRCGTSRVRWVHRVSPLPTSAKLAMATAGWWQRDRGNCGIILDWIFDAFANWEIFATYSATCVLPSRHIGNYPCTACTVERGRRVRARSDPVAVRFLCDLVAQ